MLILARDRNGLEPALDYMVLPTCFTCLRSLHGDLSSSSLPCVCVASSGLLPGHHLHQFEVPPTQFLLITVHRG